MLLPLLYLIILFGSWFLCRSYRNKLDISKNVLLVTAHPDDELMFFGPTLFNELRHRIRAQASTQVHVLCLSNGNFYGDGNVRTTELNDACQFLLRCIDADYDGDVLKVSIVEDNLLPDSPSLDWDAQRIRAHVDNYIDRHNISKVITFDDYGVSGHVNHIAICRALSGHLPSSVELWHLESVRIYRKFLSMFDMFFTLIESFILRNWNVNIVSIFNYFYLVQALRQHNSQMLWFRYLYSSTSRYMFINTLTRMVNKID